MVENRLWTDEVGSSNANPGTLLKDHLRAQFWFYRQYVIKNEEIKQKSGKVIVDRGLMGLFACKLFLYSNLLLERYI